ncbi:hypothetical protein GCM10009609_63540 [Pseudonocardia aurantiaca]|uniref:Uncharacterized protein n=1 Tax=Pseudonocardia aurantiaca TaxID=75290 RepID=A0ABW4FS93_9PSEU
MTRVRLTVPVEVEAPADVVGVFEVLSLRRFARFCEAEYRASA